MSGLTRAGDLTVGDTTWTVGELAEKGCPCVCGTHPDDHRESSTANYSPAYAFFLCDDYTPDPEALCVTCEGIGGDSYTSYATGDRHEVDVHCSECHGTGLSPQGRHLR